MTVKDKTVASDGLRKFLQSIGKSFAKSASKISSKCKERSWKGNG